MEDPSGNPSMETNARVMLVEAVEVNWKFRSRERLGVVGKGGGWLRDGEEVEVFVRGKRE